MVDLCEPDVGPLVRRLRRRARAALQAARRGRHVHGARPRAQRPGSLLGHDAIRATSPGSRTAPSSARSARTTPAPRTTGWTRPRCARSSHGLFRGLHARPHDVRHPVLDGSARLAALLHRRRAHRLALRRREHAGDDPGRAARRSTCSATTATSCRASTRSARRSSPARPTPRGRATPTRSGSSTSPRPARSGRTARATAATPSSARSASRCASRR